MLSIVQSDICPRIFNFTQNYILKHITKILLFVFVRYSLL
jgi:hypothetical protein